MESSDARLVVLEGIQKILKTENDSLAQRMKLLREIFFVEASDSGKVIWSDLIEEANKHEINSKL